jgi:hypothetical protein
VPWVYLDDHWDEHPKFLAAFELDALAPLLFISSLAYCRRNDTKGYVPGPKVKGLLGYRPKAARALLAAELWHKAGPGEGVDLHDYADWNRVSESRSASARNAARARWGER